MRSQEQYERVLGLIADGLNDCEIARRTGIPRSTVRDWRAPPKRTYMRGPLDRRTGVGGSRTCTIRHDFTMLPGWEYSYLLGLYLGDGCISKCPRVWKLRISLDSSYPGIISECCGAMESLMPGQSAYQLQSRRLTYVEVSMHSKHWPCLFPQHGPGRKHSRPILLEEWQQDLVGQYPKALLRGFVHSDGCRVVANDRGVMSVRYHFSNRSEDIKRIYCEALDRLAIHWTRPCDKQIAVYRKACTARLDDFIGPKA